METPPPSAATFLKSLTDFFLELDSAQGDRLAGETLERLRSFLAAQAATFYEVSLDKTQLLARYAIGLSSKDLKPVVLHPPRGFCAWSAANLRPVLSADSYADPRFDPSNDQATGFKTKNVLAVPLIFRGELSGTVEFINRDAGFGPEELALVETAYRTALLVQRLFHLEKLRDQIASHHAAVIENLSGGFAAIDLHGRVILLNPAARGILATASCELPQDAAEVFLKTPELADILLDTLAKKEPIKRAEITLEIEGRTKRLGYSTILIKDPQGLVNGAGLTFQQLETP